MLLASGADMNAASTDGVTPLLMASQKGYAEVVKLLLAGGANVNAKARDNAGKNHTALEVAKMFGHAAVIKLLKEHGAKE